MEIIDAESIKRKYEIKSGDFRKISAWVKVLEYIVLVMLLAWTFKKIVLEKSQERFISVTVIGAYIVSTIFFSIIFSFFRGLELKKDKAFVEEMNQAVTRYNTEKDAESYYSSLMSIRAEARDAFYIAQWRICVANALSGMGKFDEALIVIDDLDTAVSGELKELLLSTRAKIHALSSTAKDEQ